MDNGDSLVVSRFTSQSKCFSFPPLMHRTLILRFALRSVHNQLLSELPSNTWDKGKFKHIWHLTSGTSISPVFHKYDLLLRTASAYQKCRWVIVMINLYQRVFRRICNQFLPTNHQLPWSAHLTMIIITYKGAIKLKLSQCFKNYLRAVLDTKAAPKCPLQNCMFFTRRWRFLPHIQEKRRHSFW